MADYTPMDIKFEDNVHLQAILDETRNFITAEQIYRRLKSSKPELLDLDMENSFVGVTRDEKDRDRVTLHLDHNSPPIEIQDLTKYRNRCKCEMDNGQHDSFVEYRVIKINQFKIHLGSRPDTIRTQRWIIPLDEVGPIRPFPPPSGEEDLFAAIKQLDPDGNCHWWQVLSWLLTSINGQETPNTDEDLKARLEDREWFNEIVEKMTQEMRREFSKSVD